MQRSLGHPATANTPTQHRWGSDSETIGPKVRGLKWTRPRELVYRMLRDALREERHVDAEALYQCALADDEHVPLATLYRVLGDFERVGLVQVHVFEGMRKVFELEAGQPQDHVINLDTREISHLPSQRMDAWCAAIAREHGVEVVRRNVTLYVRGAPTSHGLPSMT